MTAPARIQRRPTMQQVSREAFRAFDGVTVDDRILTFIREQNGATVDEIEAALNLPHQTASAQVSHLRAPGPKQRLYASEEKRPTRRGRAAVVWKLGKGASLAPFVPPNGPRDQLHFVGLRP